MRESPVAKKGMNAVAATCFRSLWLYDDRSGPATSVAYLRSAGHSHFVVKTAVLNVIKTTLWMF